MTSAVAPDLRPRWAPLARLAVMVTVLGLAGLLPRWPGILHQVALPPVDLFADIRVLMAQANSYPVFVVALLLAVAVRSIVLAAVLDTMAPAAGRRELVRMATRFYLIAALPGILAGGMQFSAAAAVYHWDFWIGLGMAVVAFFIMAGIPFEAAARVGLSHGRPARPLLRSGVVEAAGHRFHWWTLLTYLVALALLGGAARATGRWGSVLLVPVSAWLTRWAMLRVSRARRVGRVAVAGALAVLLALAATAATARFDAAPIARRSLATGPVLFLVAGVDSASGLGSMFRLNPNDLGFPCARVAYFSYAGPGSGAPPGQSLCPITSGALYGQRDTQRPLSQLMSFFGAEVEAASRESGGRPVEVITHSQGAWIAWAAIAAGRAPSVRTLVMLGASPDVAVSYPPRGRDGPGRVGGDADRLVAAVGRGLGVSTFSPDAPLARELLATPRAVRGIFDEPLPASVKAVAVFSDFDLPVAPEGWSVRGVPTSLVPVVHRDLPSSRQALGEVTRLLGGGGGREGRLGRLLWPLLPAFGVPPSDT